MKRLLFILIFFISASTFIDAQVVYPEEQVTANQNQTDIKDTLENTVKNKKSDIIYQHDGTKMFVDVKKIYLNDLYYSLPGDSRVNKMDQRLVYKIEYKSGKVEILNETAPDVREVGDYRKVKVTENSDDVDGLIEVAKLEAKSEGSDKGYSTLKSLERNAILVLRRKAAQVNADIVLITGKKSNVAFGEIPAITLYGIAYSYR